MLRKINNKAFTIAEVIVGIAVISISLVAITLFLVSSIAANSANLKNYTASNLASEGLELFRNMRDSNWIRNLDWLGGNTPQTSKYGADFKADSLLLNTDREKENGQVKYQRYIVDLTRDYPAKMNAYMSATEGDKSDLEKQILPWKLKQISDTKEALLYQCKDNSRGIFYVHDGDLWNCTQPSLYNRYLQLEKYESKEYPKTNILRVRSIVEWQEKGSVKQIELVEDFTDWRRSSL